MLKEKYASLLSQQSPEKHVFTDVKGVCLALCLMSYFIFSYAENLIELVSSSPLIFDTHKSDGKLLVISVTLFIFEFLHICVLSYALSHLNITQLWFCSAKFTTIEVFEYFSLLHVSLVPYGQILFSKFNSLRSNVLH